MLLEPTAALLVAPHTISAQVGAITERSEWREVADELDAQRKACGLGGSCMGGFGSEGLRRAGAHMRGHVSMHSMRPTLPSTSPLLARLHHLSRPPPTPSPFCQIMVCITAPAVRVAIGEELGLGPGAVTTGQMVEAQRWVDGMLGWGSKPHVMAGRCMPCVLHWMDQAAFAAGVRLPGSACYIRTTSSDRHVVLPGHPQAPGLQLRL